MQYLFLFLYHYFFFFNEEYVVYIFSRVQDNQILVARKSYRKNKVCVQEGY